MLNVAFDMTFANRNRGGSGVYARSLLAALSACESVTAWEVSGPTRSDLPGTLSWLTLGARRALAAHPPDILHCPSFVAPWNVRLPFVVTAHDAGGRRFPGDHPFEWRVYDRMLLGRRLRSATRVITGSEFGRKELIEAYDLTGDRVVAIPYGVDARYLEPVPARAAGGDAVILFPGAPVPRKNVDAVLRCMATADPKSALGGVVLEISGAMSADFPKVASLIASLGLEARVRWLGQVPAEDMPSVIARSGVVVYPSLSEGFGFPVLEAFAVGTPVVCSNRGSLPEVVGDAALLVDPTDIRQLGQAVEALLTQDELRERFGRLGRERARTFTWRKCAEMTCDLYRAVLAEAGSRP